MAKYTSDSKLISGAGKAYKNLDNVKGAYAGLDKVVKAGTDSVEKGVKRVKEELKEEYEKRKKEEAKQERARMVNENFDRLKAGVLTELDGSFRTSIDQDDAKEQLELIKADMIEAEEKGDKALGSTIKNRFLNLQQETTTHKNKRADLANLSSALSALGNEEKNEILLAWGKEEYTTSRVDGKKIFHMTINDVEVKKTQEEIDQITILKDPLPAATYAEKFAKHVNNSKKKDRASFEYDIMNNVVPQTADGLHAFLTDDGFGMKVGQTFASTMMEPKNMDGIKKEITGALLTKFDTDQTTPGTLDPIEYKNFVDAIANPNNSYWEGNKETWRKQSSIITTELLANMGDNAWEEEQKKKKFIVGNEYPRGGVAYIYQQDGSFLPKPK